MSIDKAWRSFVEAKNQKLIVERVISGISYFFSHCEELGLIEGIPSNSLVYQQALQTKELSKINAVLTHAFEFSFGETSLLRFHISYKEFKGYREYNQLLSLNDETIFFIDRYADFFRSAKELITIRNVNAHLTESRNSLGWSLLAAGHVMRVIDLGPSDRQEEKLQPLIDNLIHLIDEIRIMEQDEEQELIQEVKEIPDELKEGKAVPLETVIHDEMTNLKESLSKLIETALIDQKTLFADEFGNSSTKKLDSSLNLDQEAEQEYKKEKQEGDLEEEEPTEVTLTRNLLTTSEAEMEMRAMQREFKEEYGCENWQIIAMGPIREQIFSYKVNSLEDFMNLPKFLQHYELEENKEIMDKQINSELGQKFFNLLKRIVWD